MESFKEYLIKLGYSMHTVDSYLKRVSIFLRWLDESKKNVEKSTYNTIIKYIEFLKKKNWKVSTINGEILAIRLFFSFLEVKNNPTKGIRLRGAQKSILKDVLTKSELSEIYSNFKVNEESLSQIRDKVIVGLIVFHGLSKMELSKIEIDDIDLKKGTISIRKQTTKNGRILNLNNVQIIDLYEYVRTTRKLLLGSNREDFNHLIISGKGSVDISNLLSRLTKKLMVQNEKIKGLQQIRSSVIANWVTDLNIREAQYRSGHKYVSSTEKYRQQNLHELKENLDEFFPI